MKEKHTIAQQLAARGSTKIVPRAPENGQNEDGPVVYRPRLAAHVHGKRIREFHSQFLSHEDRVVPSKHVPKAEPCLKSRLLVLRRFTRKFYKAWEPTKGNLRPTDHLYTFGVDRDLSEIFDIPWNLMEENLVPVFNPGFLSFRDVLSCLEALNIDVTCDFDETKLPGAGPSYIPTLHLIDKCAFPSLGTMGLSADELSASGRSCLSMMGFALAQALSFFENGELIDDGRECDAEFHFLMTGKMPDPQGEGKKPLEAALNRTWTLFPDDRFSMTSQPEGKNEVDVSEFKRLCATPSLYTRDPVAYSYCDPVNNGIVFGMRAANDGLPIAGARSAIVAPLFSL